jgi:hypothetical protein
MVRYLQLTWKFAFQNSLRTKTPLHDPHKTKTTTTVNELMTCHVVFHEFSVLGQCSFCMFDGFRISASCFPEEQRPFWDWMYNFWYLRWIVSLILL